MGSGMRASDAFSWSMERDPSLRSTIIAIAWLEQSPDWNALCARIDEATHRVPAFRQCVVPGRRPWSRPSWTDDPRFDLGWHLRRVDAPTPHTPDTVMTIARNMLMAAFDPARPLWEFTLVEGLVGGRAALVMKLHHALTDGIGGIELAIHLFDLVRRPVADEPEVVVEPESVVEPAPRPTRWSAAVSALRHPVGVVADGVATVRSIARTVAPVSTTLSPTLVERSAIRELDSLEVRLDDLKRAAAAAQGSVNDGFIAAVAGGIARYHEHFGERVERLRVTLPISIRKPDDPPGGNRITLIRFPVPADSPDTASRIDAIERSCRAARNEPSLRYVEPIAAVLSRLPRVAVASMLKHVDFVATDIPGFESPIQLLGSRVERCVAFGPTIGTAANFALLSYDGNCSVGISVDGAAVANPALFTECIRVGFEDVLALGGAHEPVGTPLRVTPTGA
jgi:WS/DGAT/MGAT family acyltransferase